MPSRTKTKSFPSKKTTGIKKKKKRRPVFRKKHSGICSYVCPHEKCHHLKFVKYLQWQKKKHGINFYPTLIPYQKVYHHKLYGIIKGIPDFHIAHPFKNENDEIIYSSLDIELKVGNNRLTKDEKREVALILLSEHKLVAVCYGVSSCKKLMRAYRNPKTSLEELNKLCWMGVVKRRSVLND